MEKDGMLAKVNEFTEWIRSMVTVKKPNQLHVCLDPKELNKYM